MRVKAWVRRGEDAESNSLHTLVIVPRISLSRESPVEPKPLHLSDAGEKKQKTRAGTRVRTQTNPVVSCWPSQQSTLQLRCRTAGGYRCSSSLPTVTAAGQSGAPPPGQQRTNLSSHLQRTTIFSRMFLLTLQGNAHTHAMSRQTNCDCLQESPGSFWRDNAHKSHIFQGLEKKLKHCKNNQT